MSKKKPKNPQQIPAIKTHPLKKEIYSKIDAGISPYKISDWLKKRGEKEGRDYYISTPTLYKYRRKRRLRTKKKEVKQELDLSRKSKEIKSLDKDIKQIEKALKQRDLANCSQADARTYRELILAKCRLINMKEKILKTYDQHEKDTAKQMTKVMERVRQEEIDAGKELEKLEEEMREDV